jgi:peroxidase
MKTLIVDHRVVSAAGRPLVEALEGRRLMAATPVAQVAPLNGVGNNLSHPDWGATSQDLIRVAPAAYGDGISTPGGANRPSARQISNALAAQKTLANGDLALDDRYMTAFVYAWGQFIDHDLDLTNSATGAQAQSFNVAVPTGDPYFDPAGTGTKLIYLNRSEYDPKTGTSAANPRQQFNEITAYLDGSVIYGSDPTRAAALRQFSGGRLKTSSGDLPPLNTVGLPNANDAHIFPDSQLYLAGDVRANENTELTAVQTLFVREHNRLADEIAKANPRWTDEQVFQKARAWVVGELQAITYNEFLPALLGPNAIKTYRGYNASVNPGITNEFSTAAYRVGHTMLGDDIEFLDDMGHAVHPEVALAQAFFNPKLIAQTGIDPVLKYLASDGAKVIDSQLVDSVRNFLFGPPGAGGFDLASLNIQRGRDHGLADYNTTRVAYGLPRLTTFAQITSNPSAQAALQQLYGTVDNIDLWVGGLVENHLAGGGSVGPTFAKIIADQFTRIRDGDRFWYQNVFKGLDRRALETTTLADVVRRNTGIRNIQDNVFYFNASIAGQVFIDANGNGQRDGGEKACAGMTVQLLDDTGRVVGSVVTNLRGQYKLESIQEIGSVQVRCLGYVGGYQELPHAKLIPITKSQSIVGVDFAMSASTPAPR